MRDRRGAKLAGTGTMLLAGLTRELGVFAIVGLLIGGIDDLAVDLLWLGRWLWKRIVIHSRIPRATMRSLAPPRRPGRIALFVPAWQEAAVIAGMLRTAVARFGEQDYRIYVGTYPNDPDTIRAVAALGSPRVRLVRGQRPGPTTKAECLNRVWRAMLEDERASGIRFKAIVLHDAEDVVHPCEVALYDRMIERFDLVQIPVVPLVSEGIAARQDAGPGERRRLCIRNFWARTISMTYGDEFAEAHVKVLAVREAIGAGVPSAGVGCAIARGMMDRVAAHHGGLPFDEGSLTEDYELGLRIRALGGRGALVALPAAPGEPLVAVRAHFPDRMEAAIRQKTRWITGIALAGWDRLRWEGGIAERWMRYRDRRTPVAALLLVAAYAALALNLICRALGIDPGWPPLAATLFTWTFWLAIWRVGLRACIVAHCYGIRSGLLAIPRTFLVANFIEIAAAWRAVAAYVPGAAPRWDKTAHHFPGVLPCD